MSRLKIGVAGANGAFGTKHLEALSQIGEVDVHAVMATTMAKANDVADHFEVSKRFDNYDAMLARLGMFAALIHRINGCTIKLLLVIFLFSRWMFRLISSDVKTLMPKESRVHGQTICSGIMRVTQ